MKWYLAICFSFILFHGNCQIGTLVDVEFANFAHVSQPVSSYANVGLGLKPYLSPRLNFFGIVSYRTMDIKFKKHAYVEDFLMYCQDQNSNPTQAFDKLQLHYVALTLGAEFKLSPSVRIRGKVENNILFSTQTFTDYALVDYIQFGKKALNKNMITTNAALLVRLSDSGYGLLLSTTFQPNPIRRNLAYTYDYMESLADRYRRSYIISIGVWWEYPWKIRKKGVL